MTGPEAVDAGGDPEVEELLRGAIDLHLHPAPSPFPRRVGILQAARDAAAVGFEAIAVKSHHAPMQTDVLSLREVGLAEVDLVVHSGIVLNRWEGGFNPYAVELTLSMGGVMVWMPTISAAAHIDYHRRVHDSAFPTPARPLREHEPMSALDDSGAVVPELLDVLALIAEFDGVLNTGHLSADEIDVVIPAARAAGVERIVVSHPTFVVDASPDRCVEWVRQGARIEHCIVMAVDRPDSPLTQDLLDAYIRACGVDRTIISSDLGQAHTVPHVAGYRRMIRRLLDAGHPADDVRRMVGGTAREVLAGALGT